MWYDHQQGRGGLWERWMGCSMKRSKRKRWGRKEEVKGLKERKKAQKQTKKKTYAKEIKEYVLWNPKRIKGRLQKGAPPYHCNDGWTAKLYSTLSSNFYYWCHSQCEMYIVGFHAAQKGERTCWRSNYSLHKPIFFFMRSGFLDANTLSLPRCVYI